MALHIVFSSYVLRLLYNNMNRKLKFRLRTKQTNETAEMQKNTISHKECKSISKEDDKCLENTGSFESGTDKFVGKTDASRQEIAAINLSEEVQSKDAETNEASSFALGGAAASTAKFSITFTIFGEMKIDPVTKKTNEQPLVNLNINTESPKLTLSLTDNDSSRSSKMKSTDTNTESNSAANPVTDTANDETKSDNETLIQTQALASALENFVKSLANAMTNMPLPSAASSIPTSQSNESINLTADNQRGKLPLLGFDRADKQASGITNPMSAPLKDDQEKSIPNFGVNNKSPLFSEKEKSTAPKLSFKNAPLSWTELKAMPAWETKPVFGFGSQSISDGQDKKFLKFEIEAFRFGKVQKPQGYDFATSAFNSGENNSPTKYNFNKPNSSLVEKKAEPVLFCFGNPAPTSPEKHKSKPAFDSAYSVTQQSRPSSAFNNYGSNRQFIKKAIRQTGAKASAIGLTSNITYPRSGIDSSFKKQCTSTA